MNRGSLLRARMRRSAEESFNEAPIHESGKYVRICVAAGPAVASMRPRFMNRGSDHLAGRARVQSAASMRPRFMNRGSPHVNQPRRSRRAKLQ